MTAMRDPHNPVRLMGRRLLIAALAILAISALWGVANIYQKNKESARLRAEAEAQLADLQARQQKLQADYDELKTQRGMEQALRQQYAVGKSGEGMIVIVEPDKPQTVQATTTRWQWIKNIFWWW